MDCSLPGSFVHGILQARILEWVAISFSRVSSPPRDRTGVSYISCTCRRVLYHERHRGSPSLLDAEKESLLLCPEEPEHGQQGWEGVLALPVDRHVPGPLLAFVSRTHRMRIGALGAERPSLSAPGASLTQVTDTREAPRSVQSP